MDTSELKRLIRQCEAMEHGVDRLKAALYTLPLADENGDPWCCITSRYLVSWGYLMVDDHAKALPFCAEFFYLLEQYPQIKLGAIFELSLAHESVIVALRLPQIPWEQCRALLDQFELRSKHYNMGKYYLHQATFAFNLEMGMYEEAACSLERFRVEQMDPGWNCEGCKVGEIASALLALGHREQALHTAHPLLTGALQCKHGLEPSNILSSLLESDLECGSMDEACAKAAQLTHMGFRNRGDLCALSMCLLYRAATDPERSLQLLEKGIAWSIGMLDLTELFDLYRSAWAVCTVLARTHTQLSLQLPKKFPVYQEDGEYQTQALAEWFYGKAEKIAQKFDLRNNTEQCIQKLRWVEKGICQI